MSTNDDCVRILNNSFETIYMVRIFFFLAVYCMFFSLITYTSFILVNQTGPLWQCHRQIRRPKGVLSGFSIYPASILQNMFTITMLKLNYW